MAEETVKLRFLVSLLNQKYGRIDKGTVATFPVSDITVHWLRNKRVEVVTDPPAPAPVAEIKPEVEPEKEAKSEPKPEKGWFGKKERK